MTECLFKKGGSTVGFHSGKQMVAQSNLTECQESPVMD